jgi:ATP phosphoribosyltransferase regulatory subunit HisZ
VQKPTLSNKFKPHAPASGFGPNIMAFAAAVVELQEKRHAADYDVMIRMNKSDALLAVNTAKAALKRFSKASKTRRLAFLSLLLFPPR